MAGFHLECMNRILTFLRNLIALVWILVDGELGSNPSSIIDKLYDLGQLT